MRVSAVVWQGSNCDCHLTLISGCKEGERKRHEIVADVAGNPDVDETLQVEVAVIQSSVLSRLSAVSDEVSDRFFFIKGFGL
jgi:hypothetical protein